MAGYAILSDDSIWKAVTEKMFNSFTGQKEMLFCETFEEAQAICASMTKEQMRTDAAIAFELALNAQ